MAVKKVSREHAYKLGLWNEREANRSGLLDAEELEIPCWRYALISLPHPILKQGLSILDTAGLNVLRVEPELTLSLFPSAEAIIFVLATDSDDTSCDLEIWRNYINRVRRDDQVSVAVVMNKIDALWDSASDESAYSLSVAPQITGITEKLGIDKQLIFPVSARQALMAKINSDPDLLEKSRLANLESYLSDSVLSYRGQLSKQSIIKKLVFLLNKSLSLSETKYKYALDQLEEFKQIDCDNADMISKLMAETQERQQVYLLSVEKFQASRRVFSVQAKTLIDALSQEKVNLVIQRSKQELTKGLTTYALKQNIQLLFDDLREVLLEAVETANETQELVGVIHRKFGEKYGVGEGEVKLFSLDQYQFELEQILTEGETFRSSLKTTMTEQSIVVKKLYSSIISKIRDVFYQANQDATEWSDSVLLPLMRQIKEHKKQTESRLHMLRKISNSNRRHC
ncbi:dynamin family protein [Methylococcaceae bacterium HT4]|nr:dynamin family protein [Methylococcaceae bacterium HT4]TXL20787.1 dynamin family protein [Methylococcaceae bacterium HT5]